MRRRYRPRTWLTPEDTASIAAWPHFSPSPPDTPIAPITLTVEDDRQRAGLREIVHEGRREVFAAADHPVGL